MCQLASYNWSKGFSRCLSPLLNVWDSWSAKFVPLIDTPVFPPWAKYKNVFHALIENVQNRLMETLILPSTAIPPLFPVWYGLMRICRAAGLVILVNSWARLGSGSRPFLLLRIWRLKENTHTLEADETVCACVCVQYVFWSYHYESLMAIVIITLVYIIGIRLQCQQRGVDLGDKRK